MLTNDIRPEQVRKRPTHIRIMAGISSFCLLLMLSACSAFGGTSTTTIPSAQDLLHNAQLAIAKVSAYHFNLVAQNPGTAGLLTITSADGDIVVPDKLKADAKALVFNNTVAVKIVAIGSKQYVTDPITGQWTTTTGLIDPRTLADPQSGVAAIIGHIQNPSTPKDSSSDGTPCWSIDGTLDTKYLSGITGVNSTGGKTVAITTCIGKADNLPYLIRINGVAAQGDTDKTTRTFKLSKFNEHITINAPI